MMRRYINSHKYFLFFVFLNLAWSQITMAQTQDTKGTEFWLGFPKNHTAIGVEFSFFISADENAEVLIEVPGLNFSDNLTVVSGVTSKYILPDGVQTLLADTPTINGIKVSSDIDVTVYGLSRLQFTTDAYLSLPLDVIGSDYMVMAFPNTTFGESQYLIVATEDDTEVTINSSIYDSCADDLNLVLNTGESYLHEGCALGDDLTGTEIISSAPISLFGGNECANVPDSDTVFCDHLIEQIPPTKSWGTQFLLSPLAERLNGETVRFLASEDDTVILSNGVLLANLAKGEVFQTNIDVASFIESTKPILTVQYSNGTSFDGVVSDPFMMMIPPFEQYLDSYTFAAPTEGFSKNYVNVIVRTSSISSLLLDQNVIDSTLFQQIFNTDYSYAQIPIGPGSHRLTGAVAGVFVYGYDKDDSYGYPGGLSLSSVATVDNISLFDEYELIDGKACFKVLVSDLNDIGIEDIRVDFIVDLLEGNDRTDPNGIAEFCIEAGVNPGDYVVSATVGSNSAQATVTLADLAVTLGKLSIGSRSFSADSGENIVLAFEIVSNSSDLQVDALTVAAAGDLNEISELASVRLYLDSNKNGVAEAIELLDARAYPVDNGQLSFSFSAQPLSVGSTQFLITYDL